MMRIIIASIISLFYITHALAQINIPESHSNLGVDSEGRLFVNFKGEKILENPALAAYTLDKIKGNPEGTKDGLVFNFEDSTLTGTIYYGFIPYGDSKHPMPVYFKSPAQIIKGRAAINISKNMRGRYDMIGWERKGKGTIGYRVVSSSGLILYNGVISFQGRGPFEIADTIIEGPMVNCLKNESVVISFTTNLPVVSSLVIDGREFMDKGPGGYQHEIRVEGLEADTEYLYRVKYGDNEQQYSLKTSPEPGTRKPFVFSYASDSREGQGGGERNVHGVNYYIMRKIMALSTHKQVAFIQFTGDLINGYLTNLGEMDLQYANWKSAVGPFAHYFPVYAGMGNHEAFMRSFGDLHWAAKNAVRLDGFPYQSLSAEALFAKNFVNPQNGPDSEDGTVYDPNPQQIDFPSYSENAYFYTYDNVAMIVMNTDYWYSPSTSKIPIFGGGVHGYIMDNQLTWLQNTIRKLELNSAIDHIFITGHTPFFPNGGHIRDDMWYSGNNQIRPYVAGKQVAKGIIERRDELLDLLINQSQKVVALLTGDEHNYNKLEIGRNTDIYLPDYQGEKLNISRTIYQVNNGAAGAPYYAQEKTPWSAKVSGFTTQNALVFFYVDGKTVRMEVMNPETLEHIDQLQLR